MQNKSYDNVKKPRAFSKGRTRAELTITPIRWMLTKRRDEIIFGHSPQTITIGVVRMLYPRDTERIRYNIRCDNYAHTSNASNEERY